MGSDFYASRGPALLVFPRNESSRATMPPVRKPAPQPIASLTLVMMLLQKGGRRRSTLTASLIPQTRNPVPKPIAITGPYVVLESGRLPGTTVRTRTRLGAQFPGFPQPQKPSQTQAVSEPPHPLEVHRPAPSDQEGMNPPVAETGMSPSQPFDLSDQGLIASPSATAVSQDRTRPSHHAADPSL